MTQHLDVELACFQGLTGLRELSASWAELAAHSGTHFLHYPAWYEAELALRDNKANVFFIAVYQRQSLVSVLAFERVYVGRSYLKIPILRLFYPNEMGVNDVLTSVPLCDFRAQLSKFMRSALPTYLLIQWQCVLFNGGAATFGAAIRESHASKYLDISHGVAAFWSTYSKKFVKGLQKKSKKAQEEGDLRLEVVRDKTDLASAFEVFLAIEDSGWKGQRGTSVRKQPKKQRYYEQLLQDYGALGVCQINILWSGQKPIAAQFGLLTGKTLYLLKIGFDESLAHVSPGYLILYELINRQENHADFERISFVTGVDWIDRWKPSIWPVGVFYSSNGTWWGDCFLKLLNTKLAKRLLTRAG